MVHIGAHTKRRKTKHRKTKRQKTKRRKQNVDLQNVGMSKLRHVETSTCQNVDYNKTSTTTKRRKVYLNEYNYN
jgi:hypothetical protein